MITIEKKDVIVAFLASSEDSICDLYSSDFNDDGITPSECDMILRQLEKMKLIDIQTRFSHPSGFIIAINSGLHKFAARGGFAAQELILSTQLEKLDVELQLMRSKLDPDMLEQLNHAFSILGSACSMIPYIKAYLSH